MRDLLRAELIEMGHINPGRWQRIADTYVELGMAEPGGALEGFVYTPEPAGFWAQRALRLASVLALTTGAAAVALLLFNNRLRRAVRLRTLELSQVNSELTRHRENLEELVRERTREIEEAMAEVKTLRGLLPICSSCKKIRDDEGRWSSIESFVGSRSDAEFTHSICPECSARLYPHLEAEGGE